MSKKVCKISIIPLLDLPMIETGDDLARLLIDCLSSSGEKLLDNDILVLSQKAISKAEGNIIDLNQIIPSPKALQIAREVGKDPRIVHLVLRESKRVVRKAYGVLVMEHKRGWICADAGVDFSNVSGDCVTLLPEDPDRTASTICARLSEHFKVDIAVLICDSQGRPFRNGSVGAALGCAGMPVLVSLIGHEDLFHYKLQHTQIAIADQIASAANLVMGESAESVPAAIVRGLSLATRHGTAKELIREQNKDLFR